LLIVLLVIFFCFTQLNTVYAKLEPEESMSEMMNGPEIHAGGLDKEKEGRTLNFNLYRTFDYHSTCYFPPLNTIYAEFELEESMSELMTGHEVHDRGDGPAEGR
jgi:hypothetical protein